MVSLYTDGSADNRTGIGGYGFVVLVDGVLFDTGGGFAENTTSNRMEMLALLDGVTYAKQNLILPDDQPIHVVSDSRYVVDGVNHWLGGWQRRNFAGVKNTDLWKDIRDLLNTAYVKVKWKRGHCSSNYWNNLADEVANEYRNKLKNGI